MNSKQAAKAKQVNTDTNSTFVKRRTPRRLFQRSLGVLVGGHYLVVAGRQLSEGGLLFEIPQGAERIESLHVGAVLAITLLLPAGEGLVLRGRVIYHAEEQEKSEAAGIAVRFDEIQLHQRRLIRNYVSSKPVGEKAQE